MKYQNHHSKYSNNQITNLVAIFSVLFASVFVVAIILSEHKGVDIAKATVVVSTSSPEPSLTSVTDDGLKDIAAYSHVSTGESKTTKLSGTSSSISNYINAWKLIKVTPVSQITV